MAKRTRLGDVDFAEVVSEGNMALIRAVDKFNVDKGFKFSTYACRAILKAFSRTALKSNRHRMRFPVEFEPDMEKSDWSDRKRDAVTCKFRQNASVDPEQLARFVSAQKGTHFTPDGMLKFVLKAVAADDVLRALRTVLEQLSSEEASEKTSSETR